MRDPIAIIEMDEEHDRKTCLALDLKVTGANQELAQWLIDHPRYSNMEVAGWLGCGKTRVWELRQWATNGFIGSVSRRSERMRSDRGVRGAERSPLESLDNSSVQAFGIEESEDSEKSEGSDVAHPAVIEDNILHTLHREGAIAAATKKIIKVSSLDREAKSRISEAIERLIVKWRSTQATLTRKDQGHEA